MFEGIDSYIGIVKIDGGVKAGMLVGDNQDFELKLMSISSLVRHQTYLLRRSIRNNATLYPPADCPEYYGN